MLVFMLLLVFCKNFYFIKLNQVFFSSFKKCIIFQYKIVSPQKSEQSLIIALEKRVESRKFSTA